jgi:hypothetical protein
MLAGSPGSLVLCLPARPGAGAVMCVLAPRPYMPSGPYPPVRRMRCCCVPNEPARLFLRQSQRLSPAQAGPQPSRFRQEGTERERIPPTRLLHDPAMLGQRLRHRTVAFRRDAVNPGAAAPADNNPVTPAVGVTGDACHGPETKRKSGCHFSQSSLNVKKRSIFLTLVRGLKITVCRLGYERRGRCRQRYVRRCKQTLYRCITSICNTVAYCLVADYIQKHRHDSYGRNDRNPENLSDRFGMNCRIGKSAQRL